LAVNRLDAMALRQGGSVAALFALPFGIAAAFFRDDRQGLASVLTALVLLGLVLGAGVAAWKQRTGTPLTHGIVTAVGVFLVIQTLGIVRRALAGEALHWSRIISSLVLSAVAGVVGGLMGSWAIKPSARPPEGRSS
jgi:hypothetical protein